MRPLNASKAWLGSVLSLFCLAGCGQTGVDGGVDGGVHYGADGAIDYTSDSGGFDADGGDIDSGTGDGGMLGSDAGPLCPPTIDTCTSTVWVQADYTGASTGSQAQPFRTIHEGTDVVADGGCVVLRAGIYGGAQILRGNFTLKGAPGEKVIVSGMRPITGWVQHLTNDAGTIYKTTLDWRPNRLFTGWVEQNLSHAPQEGWFNAASIFVDDTSLTDPTNLTGLPSLVGGSVASYVRGYGRVISGVIQTHNTATSAITYTSIGGGSVVRRYIVTNVPALILPGQWAVTTRQPSDAGLASYTVYYQPISASDLAATQAPDSTSTDPVLSVSASQVTIRDLIVIGGNKAGISVAGDGGSIQDCIIVHNGTSGATLGPGNDLSALHNFVARNQFGIAVGQTQTALISENEATLNYYIGIRGDGSAAGVVISRNYVHHQVDQMFFPSGILFEGRPTTPISGVIDENVTMFNGADVNTFYGTGSGTANLALTGNLVADAVDYGLTPCNLADGGYTIAGNTFVGDGRETFTPFVGVGFALTNNVYGQLVADVSSLQPPTTVSGWVSDYNLYYSYTAGGPIASVVSDSYNSISAFSARTGQDVHSKQAPSGAPLLTRWPLLNGVVDEFSLSSCTRTSLVLRATPADAGASFTVGDHIEINGDGVSRTVTAVSGSTITFDVPLPMKPFTGNVIVENWGPTETSFARDARLPAGSLGLTLSQDGGPVGSTLSISSFEADDFAGCGRRMVPVIPAEVQAGIPAPNSSVLYRF